MRMVGNACVALSIALVVMTSLGCATGGSVSASPITASTLPTLAGSWNGWIRLPNGNSTPGTMDMTPGGDYVVKAGAFVTEGRAQVKDGGLVLVSTGGTGSFAASDRASMATLNERSDGTKILRGAGRDATAGPFDFEFTKSK